MLVSFHYYTYIEPQINYRVIIFSLCFATQSFICARALLNNNNLVHKAKTQAMGYFFFTIGLFHLFRLASMVNEPTISNFMTSGSIHSLSIASFLITICFISFILIWMANTTLEEELKELARIDPLTRVNNRRSLEEAAKLELSRTIRNNPPLSIIMCDIDHFKQFNDLHGHQVGDDVLINVASILVNNVRKNDMVCRYGGEEFLILLPETSIEQATTLSDKIR
jgi:predicted signal transduction protein with EAL and GGDEF domain